MKTIEDDVWVYYGYPNEYWRQKCKTCRHKVLDSKRPQPECINCWKVEIWSESPWLLEAEASTQPFGDGAFAFICGFLSGLDAEENMERLKRVHGLAFRLYLQLGARLVAKVSKYPIQLVRTGEPLIQYPNSKKDFLFMIYASSIRERDELRRAVCRILHVDPSVIGTIPVRRGCWVYENILGPWQKWYQMDEDCKVNGPF